MTTKKPINYLNNRDILKEIHISKNSYCSYVSPQYSDYDYIMDCLTDSTEENLQKLTSPEILAQAKATRASRLSTPDNPVDPASIMDSDVVFRVMTWDHIPLSPKVSRKVTKKRTAKDIFEFDDEVEDIFAELDEATPTPPDVDDMVHMKVNFPPFQHFKLNHSGELVCVGKSHWRGDLDSGEFSKDHGKISNKLAKMYIMMCEKYAMKFNWRNYTYRDEMQNSAILQLTYVGLRFNEAKSENPFAYYTQAITNSFYRVLNTEKRNQNIRDDMLEISGLNPSWTRMHSSSESGSFYDE